MKRFNHAILLLLCIPCPIFAQTDYKVLRDPHYSVDSAYISVDSISFDIPTSKAIEKIERSLELGKGIVWHSSDIKLRGGMLSGRIEFLYEPDSLLDVRRMGYLSAYTEIRVTDRLCTIQMKLWVHRTAVESMSQHAIGPISKGEKCAKSLCFNLGVPNCSIICETELWPALNKAQRLFVEHIVNALKKH